MFQGFTEETVDFLWGIRFNNERPWFEAHKEVYTRSLYQPMKALAEELHAALAQQRPELIRKVSRIYRDARRLHGRGPYKESLWFTVEPPTEPGTDRPAFWFELMPEGWSYGLGYWVSRPVTMAKLRGKIDRDPAAMEALTRKLLRQSEFTLHTTDYQKPRAPAPSAVLEPWYRAKYFSITHAEPLTEELYGRELAAHLERGYEFLLPYYDYFRTVSGEPDPRDGGGDSRERR